MASTRGRKRARAESTANHSGRNRDALDGEDPAPGESQPGRRYSTRRSTQDSHPGVAAGLAKRHKTDIQAEAAQRKAQEAAKREKKEKCEAAKAAREREGAKRAAAMLDERARQEQQEIEEVERTPSENNEARARDAGTLAGEGANDGKQRSTSSLDDDDDNLSDNVPSGHHAQQSPSSPNSLSSFHPEGSESGLSDSDDDFVEQRARLMSKGKEPQGPGKVSKSKQKGQGSESTTQDVGTGLPGAPSKKKKLTETERRAARLAKLRNEIARKREVVPNKTAHVGAVAKPAGSSRSGAAASKGKGPSGDAFTADYRSRACAAPQTPASKASSASTSAAFTLSFIEGSTASSSSVAPSQHDDWAVTTFNFINDARTPSTSEPLPLSDEELGGLNDASAATPVPTRLQKRTLLVARGPAKNTMVGVLPMSLIEGDEVVDTPKKRTRAPRTKLSVQQSRGLPALLVWIQASMISVIIPSLIKHFGALDNPWDDDQFAAVFSALMRKLHPDREVIVQGSKEWRYARQGVYDWRSNFGKLAIKLVTKAAKRIGSTTAISVWANNALAKGGEATYSQPNTISHEDARGALHTPLHIQLLASHYSAAEGAIVATSYPVGALSLANVAIRRAFTAFKTRTFIAQDDFTDLKYGDATTKSRKGAVKGLEDIPHWFDGLVAMAMAQLPSFKRAEAEKAEQVADDEDAYAAVDPPTSPPAAHQY